MLQNTDILLEGKGIHFSYPGKKVLQDVSFTVHSGETFGIVGESGSGKTTLVKLIARLLEPESGQINFQGKDILPLQGRELLPYRRQVQVVFQDPYGSINPWMRVGEYVGEPLRIQGLSQAEIRKQVAEILEHVGLFADYQKQYPHRFSGGQRQRMAIARALITKPTLILCDEPVSALDVSIQSQILNLFKDLQEDFGLTYLFISHNLAVIRQMSDQVGVMFAGTLVEIAKADCFFESPLHPYSVQLLQAVPQPDPSKGPIALPEFDQAHPMSLQGCAFYQRCPKAFPRCATEVPLLRSISKGRQVACHFIEDESLMPRDGRRRIKKE